MRRVGVKRVAAKRVAANHRRAGRWFRSLVRLFPRDFRDDYGRQMEGLYLDQRADAEHDGGRFASAGLGARTLLGLLRTAAAEQWDRTRQDVRHALRSLAGSPAFTLAVLLTAALGIGANTAMFSIIEAVLLRPLPYPQPERLVRLWSLDETSGNRAGVSLQDLENWRRADGFDAVAAWNEDDATLTGLGDAARVRTAVVTTGFLAALGVPPAEGRGFVASDHAPGDAGAAIVSTAFERRRLGGGGSALGRTVHLDGAAFTVVGVMPPRFDFPSRQVEVWLPLRLGVEDAGPRDGRWLSAVGRLAPATGLAAARDEMRAVSDRLAAAYPDSHRGWTIAVESLHEVRLGDVRRALVLLWGAVVLLLAIACANLASLLLSRAAVRRQEMAVRTALGAGPGRLMRQMLTESVVLASVGAAAGLAFARLAIALLPHLAPDLPGVETVALDGGALAFTLLLAIAAGLLFGLAPAVAARRAPAGGLSGGVSATGGSARTWNAVVAAEVAMTVVVLVAAGLLASSFAAAVALDAGFPTDGLLAFRVEPPSRVDFSAPRDEVVRSFTRERAAAADFYRRLVERLEALPQVRSAAAINRRPLAAPGAWTTGLFLPGDLPDARRPAVRWRPVTAGWSRTIGTPIVAGRPLAASDGQDAPPVVVVNRAFADAYWPGAEALGHRLTPEEPTEGALWYTVVGVVADARYDALEEAPGPVAFVPMDQARFGFFRDWGMDVLVRTDGDPMALAPAVRRQVAALDPELPTFAITSLTDSLADQTAPRRRAAGLAGVFSLLALALAAAGIFGVVSYRVAERRHEIALRMALGADRRAVGGWVMRIGLVSVLSGLVAGALLAVPVAGLMSALLYATSPHEPTVYAAAAGLLVAIALSAAAIPARRAATTDPLAALRG